ncbi:MAG TPA: transketolase [Pyrinomonadaceae bacterium]|nr:transketolase [Pyrinomonadaceae bacterium]
MTAPMTQQTIEELSINTIRTLSLDAVQKANSGHPGLPLGMAPAAYVLWTQFLRHNPKNPRWFNRDKFLLSAGHGSMLVYSLLHLTGYESVSMDEIKNFRQLHSRTPGHPENFMTEGVEITTGPLGQGFANGVGMAIGAKHLAAVFNREGFPVVDNYVYAIVSDGDLMEGISNEAASLAGHLELGNLIYLYDDNYITIDGATNLAFTEDRAARFEALGWHVQTVDDGNDLIAIEQAIEAAREVTNQPSLICVKTIIGYGMPKQGTNKAHSDAPGEEAVRETKRNLGWDEDKHFYVPDEVYEHFRQAMRRGETIENEWNRVVEEYCEKYEEEGRRLKLIMRNELPEGWEDPLPTFENVESKATRAYSGEVINAIAGKVQNLIGGSADLTGSNNTEIKSSHAFQPTEYDGRNIYYGVREHAMGAAMTGISLNGGLIPFGGTFLTFSDYMRPAIRLAALSGIQVIYVFTHDSIGLGEDGPTHQSVEHLAALRAIPKLAVIRPADAHETREAWRIALKRKQAPTAFALSRQKVAVIDRNKFASAEGTQKGAYILAEADGENPQLILIATGSEVGLALEAREQLQSEGISTRVVSMPCWELFDEQSAEYREEVLPPNIKARLAIEAGVSLGWAKYVGDAGDTLTVDKFGASAPAEDVFEEYGFTVENVVKKAKSLI